MGHLFDTPSIDQGNPIYRCTVCNRVSFDCLNQGKQHTFERVKCAYKMIGGCPLWADDTRRLLCNFHTRMVDEGRITMWFWCPGCKSITNVYYPPDRDVQTASGTCRFCKQDVILQRISDEVVAELEKQRGTNSMKFGSVGMRKLIA